MIGDEGIPIPIHPRFGNSTVHSQYTECPTTMAATFDNGHFRQASHTALTDRIHSIFITLPGTCMSVPASKHIVQWIK